MQLSGWGDPEVAVGEESDHFAGGQLDPIPLGIQEGTNPAQGMGMARRLQLEADDFILQGRRQEMKFGDLIEMTGGEPLSGAGFQEVG